MSQPNRKSSIRRRGAGTFVIVDHGSDHAELTLRSMYRDGSFVQWEEQGATLPDGQAVGPCYVLWAPAPEPLDLAEYHDLSAPPPEPEATRKPRRGKTTRHKGITRLDYPAKRMFGYMVRVAWKGQIHQKYFTDKSYGDRLAALDAAIQWRNQKEAEIGKPRTERMVYGKPGGDNPAVGISRRRENHTDYYEATWLNTEGRIQRTRFSIQKHGERKALRLALAARERNERLRYRTPRE